MSFAKILTSMQSVLKNNSGAIRNVSVTLIVFVVDVVIESEDLFQCPPQYYSLYGGGSIVVPAVFLSLVAILMDNAFWKFVRGCCFYEKEASHQKRFCCCCYPRWGCQKPLLQMLFRSSFSGFLWIILAFLRRDYYVCAVLGGTKEAKLQNAINEAEKVQIEADYANAGRDSQIIALLFLGISVTLGFVFLLVYRCCYQYEVGSLPRPYEYQKLESEAAVKAFKGNMEKLAEEQGKRRADLYFATMDRTNPSEVLKTAYENLKLMNKFDGKFEPLEDYQMIQAEAASAAFKAKVQEEGKRKVDLILDSSWKATTELQSQEIYAFNLVKRAHKNMADRYPRSTGDKGEPYVSNDTESAADQDACVMVEHQV